MRDATMPTDGEQAQGTHKTISACQAGFGYTTQKRGNPGVVMTEKCAHKIRNPSGNSIYLF